ncbi:MAG: Maf family protein, partial [Oscillospiraceae bacterium]
MKIILASTSPRRKELLHLITDDFSQINPQVTEMPYPFLSPKEKALQLSKDKCMGALKSLNDTNCV